MAVGNGWGLAAVAAVGLGVLAVQQLVQLENGRLQAALSRLVAQKDICAPATQPPELARLCDAVGRVRQAAEGLAGLGLKAAHRPQFERLVDDRIRRDLRDVVRLDGGGLVFRSLEDWTLAYLRDRAVGLERTQAILARRIGESDLVGQDLSGVILRSAQSL